MRDGPTLEGNERFLLVVHGFLGKEVTLRHFSVVRRRVTPEKYRKRFFNRSYIIDGEEINDFLVRTHYRYFCPFFFF